MSSKKKKIALGLGTNRGDRLGFLKKALRLLKTEFHLERVSPIYESKAMLPSGAPSEWDMNFLNLVAIFKTDSEPAKTLEAIKAIEKKIGRQNSERWAPREIDIDLLVYNEETHNLSGLKIPHIGLTERPFAILPLADVWPDARVSESKSALEMASPWIWSTDLPFETQRTVLSLTESVAVINVTPDSFSGDGLLNSRLGIVDSLIQYCIDAGATVIDFGAESTRPNGVAVDSGEEWARLGPVFNEILPKYHGLVKFSLDSRRPETVQRALEYDLDWINDVSGADSDKMKELAKSSGRTIIAMHSLTVPVQKNSVLSDSENPLELVLHWGFKKIEELVAAGIPFENIILDPGIGFGKTPLQNQFFLREAFRFHEWGVPVFIGHSRKSLFNPLTERPPADRDFETAMVSGDLASKGIEYLRVHDPSLTARAFSIRGFFPRG